MNATPLRILHVVAELFPLVKTGGLADVAGALPAAQIAEGMDVRVLLPGYPAVLAALTDSCEINRLGPAFGAARVALRAAKLPNGVYAYVIDAPWLYDRAGNPYLRADGSEWPDNHRRFALLSWIAAQLAAGGLDPDWTPHIVHSHDWHAALAPVYLATRPAAPTGTVLTIHNLAFQGRFASSVFGELGLPAWMATMAGLEFHGELRLLKGGLLFADRITTVSPTYAREILSPEHGHQLDAVLSHRGDALAGILNGIDPAVWNPADDPAIPAHFDAKNLAGKRRAKEALQRELGLPVRAEAPLAVNVGRMAPQKGLDLLLGALPELVDMGVQVALLGSGEPSVEQALRAAADRAPTSVAMRFGYDEVLAHRMIAGADLILVPSRFEPCGLTQLYGLRYGTLPVVRRVGGLADTVVDADESAVRAGTANGFTFDAPHPHALASAVARAVELWRQPASWRALMTHAMRQDFSWRGPARQYELLYREIVRT
jgi:starch synthase